jgi:hypothetical protein
LIKLVLGDVDDAVTDSWAELLEAGPGVGDVGVGVVAGPLTGSVVGGVGSSLTGERVLLGTG